MSLGGCTPAVSVSGEDGGTGGGGHQGCVPEPEMCDGLDNDCDGTVDEDCCCISGSAEQCYEGPPSTAGVGECDWGAQQCNDYCEWGPCVGSHPPQPELCDGLDNDCNGLTDDDVASGDECDTGHAGVCAEGSEQCEAGSWVCVPLYEPAPYEECDGLDNDCNGMVDESFTCMSGTIEDCYSGSPDTYLVGECQPGIALCDDCMWGPCEGDQTPQPELCDGLDNDCNGLTDDGCS